MQSVAVATPVNSTGASLPALPACLPWSARSQAGALIGTSRAAGDALESTGPGAAFQRVMYDKAAANVFRVSSRDGVAASLYRKPSRSPGSAPEKELAL